jgi:hypothetical protein
VLVAVPPTPADWLSCSPDQLVLQNCAYWASLADASPSDNETSVTVRVPRANLLTTLRLHASRMAAK